MQRNQQYLGIASAAFWQCIGGVKLETTSSRKQANAEQVDLGGLTPSYIFSKRCFDFLASLIGLILLSGW
jgi:lipopolysaccharide/colanic/teichoic acid biosynthesis glycosyltransferase